MYRLRGSSSLSLFYLCAFCSEGDSSGGFETTPIEATALRKHGGGIKAELPDLTPVASCCVPNHSARCCYVFPLASRSVQEHIFKGFNNIYLLFYTGNGTLSTPRTFHLWQQFVLFSLYCCGAATVLLLVKPTRYDAPDGSSAGGHWRGPG